MSDERICRRCLTPVKGHGIHKSVGWFHRSEERCIESLGLALRNMQGRLADLERKSHALDPNRVIGSNTVLPQQETFDVEPVRGDVILRRQPRQVPGFRASKQDPPNREFVPGEHSWRTMDYSDLEAPTRRQCIHCLAVIGIKEADAPFPCPGRIS